MTDQTQAVAVPLNKAPKTIKSEPKVVFVLEVNHPQNIPDVTPGWCIVGVFGSSKACMEAGGRLQKVGRAVPDEAGNAFRFTSFEVRG